MRPILFEIHGRLKPLHVTRSSSEAWWAFLPMRLRLESHLGQFSTPIAAPIAEILKAAF